MVRLLRPARDSEVAQGLLEGKRITDSFFDSVLTPQNRRIADRYWTPIAVAKRAAELLTEGKYCTVLDVGSGVGKFCIVGALTTPAFFFGVEWQKDLVEEAQNLGNRLNLRRVRFAALDAAALDWSEFDAIYFFNPFWDNLGKADFHCLIEMTRTKLTQAKLGTRVVTFQGFGGDFPPGYERQLREPWEGDFLELWVKKQNEASGES